MNIRNKFVGNYKTIGEETSQKISQYLSPGDTKHQDHLRAAETLQLGKTSGGRKVPTQVNPWSHAGAGWQGYCGDLQTDAQLASLNYLLSRNSSVYLIPTHTLSVSGAPRVSLLGVNWAVLRASLVARYHRRTARCSH